MDVTTIYCPISSLIICQLCGRLQQVKNKGKFKTFSSKSGRGRLQEVPKVVI